MKQHRAVWVFIILFGVWIHSTCASEPPRYEIDAHIDTTNYKITARQKVTFTNNSDKEINEIYFHIYPHRQYTEKEKRFILRYAAYFNVNPYPAGFQGGDLKINSVVSGNQNLTYRIEGEDETILKVGLAQKLLPQDSVIIDLDFTVDIPHAYGRFGWHKNIMSLLRWYPLLSVLDKEGWHNYPYYPYHQPYFSEAARYLVRLSLPKEEVVVHSGILEEQIINPDGTKTLVIDSQLPLRDFGLVASRDFKVVSLETNGIKINSYYLPGDLNGGQKALECASDLMKYYSQKFISYPYKEFNIAPSFLGYGGTQSSTLILIDTRVYKLPGLLRRYFDFLVSHETGHQWFYNLVGSDEYKEMFIDEGLNSYFILKYLEDKYGPQAEVMVLPKSLKWLVPNFSFEAGQLDRYSFLAKNGLDRPVLGELFSFQEPSAIFSITYGKGSKIVDMLSYIMGEPAFERLMQSYFRDFSFKNISIQELEKLAEREAGRDLQWFFEAWLKTIATCDYAINKIEDNQIFLENRGQIYMPVEIKVELENKEILNYRWDDRQKEKVLDVNTDVKIRRVEVDPQKRILDLDRTNNYWVRQVDFRPVALYYPIYEVPVFLKDEAFSLMVGPQVAGSDLGIKTSFQKPQDNIFYNSSVYNFGEERLKNTFGFEQRHLGARLLKWGLEVFAYRNASGSNDQEGFKLYLRKELWPVSYGLLDENDHISFYLLRNRDFKSALTAGGLEEVKNLHYRQQEEAILGLNLKFARLGTYPDPEKGWRFKTTLENAEHFLGGQNYFWRFSPELTHYFSLSPKEKIAARIKLGLGYPADKDLFRLGGENGLRGYAYKTINGCQAIMFNTEYRLDLFRDLDWHTWENLISLEKIQGVGFFDVGKSWFKSFKTADFKKDIGLGLRFHLAVLGFLERLILRVDVAQTINDPEDDRRFWFGIGHSF